LFRPVDSLLVDKEDRILYLHLSSTSDYGTMNVRSIFVNKLNNLRAGWRIAIFLLLQVSLSLGIVGILHLFLRIPETVGNAVAYVILIGTTFLVLRLVDHRPFRSVGLPLHPRLGAEWGQGILLSLLMISSVFIVEYAFGYIHLQWRGDPASVIGTSFVTTLLVFLWFGFGEELLFRGYLFQTLIEGTNQYIAVLIMSVLFGAAHIANPHATPLGVVNTVLASIWLSVAYLKTRTLWFPTALHATWNFFQGFVYSFPVSGLHVGGGSLLVLEQSGPDWLTGGSYGPEAGILATLVLLTAIVYTLTSSSIRLGEGVWLLQPQSSLQIDSNQAQS
jgi:membrane protease YdiL (CAAX protease family)